MLHFNTKLYQYSLQPRILSPYFHSCFSFSNTLGSITIGACCLSSPHVSLSFSYYSNIISVDCQFPNANNSKIGDFIIIAMQIQKLDSYVITIISLHSFIDQYSHSSNNVNVKYKRYK